jgi:hypothetical protein
VSDGGAGSPHRAAARLTTRPLVHPRVLNLRVPSLVPSAAFAMLLRQRTDGGRTHQHTRSGHHLKPTQPASGAIRIRSSPPLVDRWRPLVLAGASFVRRQSDLPLRLRLLAAGRGQLQPTPTEAQRTRDERTTNNTQLTGGTGRQQQLTWNSELASGDWGRKMHATVGRLLCGGETTREDKNEGDGKERNPEIMLDYSIY